MPCHTPDTQDHVIPPGGKTDPAGDARPAHVPDRVRLDGRGVCRAHPDAGQRGDSQLRIDFKFHAIVDRGVVAAGEVCLTWDPYYGVSIVKQFSTYCG